MSGAEASPPPANSAGGGEGPHVLLTGCTKTYGPTIALNDLSLELRKGEILGLVGENGAGKSTLIGTLNGTVVPDRGKLTVHGVAVRFGDRQRLARLGMSTVFQEQHLVGTMPVFENIYLGQEGSFLIGGCVRKKAMRKAARVVFQQLGLDMRVERTTDSLSFGERQLVEIAKAFAHADLTDEMPIVLLDEPTSALSDSDTHVLFDRMREWRARAVFLFVSHRLEDILAVTDRLVVLKDGCKIDTRPTAGVSEDILHELMVGRKRDREYYKESLQLDDVQDVPILEVRHVSYKKAFRDISLVVRPGEIVGLAGVLGSGKSELALAIAGGLRPDAGEVLVGGSKLTRGSVGDAVRHRVAYVPQERSTEGLVGYLSVAWNLTLATLAKLRVSGTPFLSARKERAAVRRMVERLDIRPPRPGMLCAGLSGGNQQKCVLGKWLLTEPRVLVLDDPTRGIDVGAKEEIYALLRQMAKRNIGILLASDNMHEIIGLANRIVVMRDGVVTAEIPAPRTHKPSEGQVVRHMVSAINAASDVRLEEK